MTQFERKHPGLNLGSHHGAAHDQAEALVFGFWVFLMSDLIIFGLMFATYITMQGPMAEAGGPGPAQLYDLRSAWIQTLLLLTSSLTFGLASLAMRHKHGVAPVVVPLVVTLGLGLTFLGFELHDFQGMLAQGAGPGRSGFLSAFFGLVPLHGLHVTAGCIWLMVMLAQIAVFGLSDMVKLRLLRLGLFWHFLDIIWIGIFSIVYLAGLTG
ncbi:cytochrome c oxidase subunit 3 [Pseudoruegeria sp. SK021]|uniref:cytochrome c oxidase subunit 3 n=1 Tax=Pseudoruegeria sp. SK021 TaxID=1933035 RepID=UPI000A24C848|nr:cytochrome c oxidase subunit 3 [Pseudoruegeria sp. SK021]OSP56288.1 cytochrome o ubiquinol oxidase subunit III [Pseudoruegeria sp. SK021]